MCDILWGESGSKCVRVSKFQRESDLREGKTGVGGGGGRGRESMCVSEATCDDFVSFIQTTRGQIKKLYSNWYDQAEH